jgi:hypothetical protein
MIAEVGGKGSHQKGKTTYIYLSEMLMNILI